MTSFAHYLITRFNLRGSLADRRPLDPAWLTERLDLFERFCLPTVKGQTEQNFRWLVMFDPETPEFAQARIREYAKWPNFVPIFLWPGVEGAARKAVQAQLGEPPEILVTTRLDNDDGLCRTFVEQIQRRAHVTAPTVLEFPVGYVWHKSRIYRYHFPHNAFGTLVEPRTAAGTEGFLTVCTGSHLDIGRLGTVVEVSPRPSWLQVVHGGNLENRPRGIRQSRAMLQQDFDLDPDLFEGVETPGELLVDKMLSTVRTGILAAARRVPLR
jgi:hypothetical protein